MAVKHGWLTSSSPCRFEYGFGLSYTTFDYSSLNIRSTDMKKRNNDGMSSTLSRLGLYDDAFTVTFDVKNSGSRDGHEVSQLYLVSLIVNFANRLGAH